MVSRILAQEGKNKKFPRSNNRNLPPQDSAPAHLLNDVHHPGAGPQQDVLRQDAVPRQDTLHKDAVLPPEGVSHLDDNPLIDDSHLKDGNHHHLL